MSSGPLFCFLGWGWGNLEINTVEFILLFLLGFVFLQEIPCWFFVAFVFLQR